MLLQYVYLCYYFVMLFQKWLEGTFLPYLNHWEESVEEREGFNASQKKRMLLSTETMLGLRMTCKLMKLGSIPQKLK